MSDRLPDEIRDFLRKNISSISVLEVLFLLKHNPDKQWSALELSKEMRTNPSYARSQLEELVAAKVLQSTKEDRFQYAPDEVRRLLVDELESQYINRRYAVMNFIYSQPIDSIRDFANAFKIKKD